MSVKSRIKILDRLKNFDYRHALVESHNKLRIALMIREAREKQGLSQGQLADKMGKHQTHISRLEGREYGGYTLNSLLEVFKALDVALIVKAIPFDEFMDDSADLSPETLAPDSFTSESGIDRMKVWAGLGARLKVQGEPSITRHKAIAGAATSQPSSKAGRVIQV